MSPRQPRQHDRAFLGALHRLPCIVCGSWRSIEAAHIRLTSHEWSERTGVRTGAGGAEKPSDRWSLPLCSHCHRDGPDAEHVIGTVAFWRMHGLDPHAIADELYRASPDVQAMTVVVSNVHLGLFGKTS